jgi:hypothetical protein
METTSPVNPTPTPDTTNQGQSTDTPTEKEIEQATETAITGEKKEPVPKPPEPKEVPKKHKLKYYGKEEEVDESVVIERAQKWSASEDRLRAAAKKEKEIADKIAELTAFEKDPWSHLHSKGKDPYQMAEDLLMQKLQWEQMSPEQKQIAQQDQEKAQLEQRLKTFEDKEKELHRQKVESEFAGSLDQEIADGLKSLGKKPMPWLVRLAASEMLAHLDSGSDVKLSGKDAVGRAHKYVQTAAKEMLESSTVEELEKLLPKTSLDALRKLWVTRAKSQDPFAGSKPRSNDGTFSTKKSKAITSTDDWFDTISSKLG